MGVTGVFQQVQTWAVLVIAVGSVLTLLLGKGVVNAIAGWRDRVIAAVVYAFSGRARSDAALVEFKLEAAERWKLLLAELRPNGGTSLRDAIARIETRQIKQAGRLDLIMLVLDDQVSVYETDSAGECTWVSPAYCKVTGRTLDECLGLGWVVIIHQDDMPYVRAEWSSALADHRAFALRFRMVRADGQVFKVFSRARPLVNGKTILGWSGLLVVEE